MTRTSPSIGRLGRLPISGHGQCQGFSRPFSPSIFAPKTFLHQRSSIVPKLSAARLTHHARTIHSTAPCRQSSSNEEAEIPGRGATSNELVEFEDLGRQKLVNQTVVDTLIKQMRLKTLTTVQSMTVRQTLKGVDVLAQARTGTGKTLAFLLPVLQKILNDDPSLAASKWDSKGNAKCDIRAIIISPTRELAEQIAVEAQKLVWNIRVVVQVAAGGSARKQNLRDIMLKGCHILVGTPGRLHDILTDPREEVRAPRLGALVLDEADRLLEQGFSRALGEIQASLPNRQQVDRQTLLFTATLAEDVKKIARNILKPEHEFVQTFKDTDQPTHAKVPQFAVVVAKMENLIPALVELCLKKLEEFKDPGVQRFKAIIYLPAVSETALVAEILRTLQHSGDMPRSIPIITIHSKMNQPRRTSAAREFYRRRSAILVSSDVTARGMDFPDVTHVIQMNVPQNQEQYVHRLGRTGRVDKDGEGWLLCTQQEVGALQPLMKRMPLQLDKSLKTATVNMGSAAQLDPATAKLLTATSNAARDTPDEMRKMAYLAGFTVHRTAYDDKHALAKALDDRCKYGWASTRPAIEPAFAKKLGLRGIPHVTIGLESPMDFRAHRRVRPRQFSGRRVFERNSRPVKNRTFKNRFESQRE